MPVTRVAVVGVSHWHAPLYLAALERAGAVVVAVTDRNALLAAAVADRLGAVSGDDIEALLERVQPDLAIILGAHADMADAALVVARLGVPLVLEKPGALSMSELSRAHVQLAGHAVAVPLVHRLAPFAREIGAAGPLTHLTISYLVGPPERYPAAGCDWMLDPASGGGVLANLGAHFADLVLHLGGQAVDVVARVSHARHGLAIEDHAVMVILTESGLTATIDLGYLYPDAPDKRHVSIVATGSAGAVSIGPEGVARRTHTDGSVTRRQLEVDSDPLFGAFVERAVRSWRQGFPGLPGMHELVEAMAVVDAAYRAAGGTGEQAWAM